MKLSAVLALIIVCFALSAGAQQYTINAHVTGFANGAKFYLKDLDAEADVDSTTIQNDRFVLKGQLAQTPQSLWLYSQSKEHFYYVVLLIGNEQISITGDAKDFPFDLSVTGSKTQDDQNTVTSLIKSGYKKRNELVSAYFALSGDSAKIKGKQIWKTIAKIDSADQAIRKGFISTHLNSYEGLSELYFLLDKYPADSIKQMYASLKPEFKQSRYGARINNFLKVGKKLEKGDMAMNFEAFDRDGAAHHLLDTKGKYILLDFASAYCGPCIASIEDIKLVSKKYADRIEVVSFSVDAGKSTWVKALTRDKPTWLNLWDGKGSYGETILKYGVTGYPDFFIIDPDGRIVDTWFGYDKNPGEKGTVESKVDAILAKAK